MTESFRKNDGNGIAKRRNLRMSSYISYVPGIKIHFYSPPSQCQKWGSDQLLPHVNWGDLFFDLFYVAGFYNLGKVLLKNPSWIGLLYFLTSYLGIWQLWQDKLLYDARFVYGDDILHKIFETVFLIILGTAVSYIAPVSKMSNTSYHVEMFGYSISITLALMMNSARVLEYYRFGRGQRKVIEAAAKNELKFKTPLLLFYMAATVIAGFEYFRGNDDHQRRELAGDEKLDCGSPNYIPIILILIGFLLYFGNMLISIIFCFPKDGGHKKFNIPMHVEFVIHRQGEWSMLVLGESVLSLLIVDAGEDSRYFSIFYCGIVTVILLQLLHFRNQPSDPNGHAMRRHKNAGISFMPVFALYSAALIAVGSSFKMFLYDLSDNKRRLLSDVRGRSLDGGDDYYGCGPTSDEKKEIVAHLFSVAMTIVFVCLDVMLVLHVGLKKGIEKCKVTGEVCQVTGVKKISYNIKGIILIAFQVAITIFMATLGLWQTDPARLAELGVVAVFCQLVVRFLGNIIFQFDENLGHSHHNHHHGAIEDEDDDLEYTESEELENL